MVFSDVNPLESEPPLMALVYWAWTNWGIIISAWLKQLLPDHNRTSKINSVIQGGGGGGGGPWKIVTSGPLMDPTPHVPQGPVHHKTSHDFACMVTSVQLPTIKYTPTFPGHLVLFLADH